MGGHHRPLPLFSALPSPLRVCRAFGEPRAACGRHVNSLFPGNSWGIIVVLCFSDVLSPSVIPPSGETKGLSFYPPDPLLSPSVTPVTLNMPSQWSVCLSLPLSGMSVCPCLSPSAGGHNPNIPPPLPNSNHTSYSPTTQASPLSLPVSTVALSSEPVHPPSPSSPPSFRAQCSVT